jgi:subtilisin family serine protease
MFTFSSKITKYITASFGILSLFSHLNQSRADVQIPSANNIVAARQQTDQPVDYDTSTVLVQFKSGLTPQGRNQLLSKFDGVVLQKFSLVPGLTEVRVGTSVGDALKVLQASHDVIAAEPNYRFRVADVPNDPNFSKQWSLDAIDATRAWSLHKGTHSLRIAVLDTGIDKTHPEFADNIWTNPREIAGDGIDNDANGYIDDTNGWDFTYTSPGTLRGNGDNNPADGHGHGTHVSGIIAAQGNNAIGVTGICWDAAIVPLKVAGDDGSGFTSWMIAAIEYCARNGISIANASIGGASYSGFCKAAIDAAGAQSNLLLVAAAGNNGTDNDATPFYPASYDAPNIVSVASTTSADALSSFSNRGLLTVDIAAPGSSITSTHPQAKTASGYTTLSGTSMATPMVTAVAGLLHENRPEWSFAEIKSALLASVTPISGLSGKVASGGLVNAYQAMVLSNAVEVVGLRLSKDILRGGDSVTAEITLDRISAAGGVVVELTSSNPAVRFPESVQIPGGMSTVSVSGLVAAVGSTTRGDVSATVQGQTLAVPVTVKPPMLAAVTVGLTTIAPGGVTKGVVSLAQPAGDAGLDVILTSDIPGIVVPASVHIDAGQTDAEFSIAVDTTCLGGVYQIKASTDADCVCVDLSVLATALKSVVFTPSVVASGLEMSLQVTLSAPAPTGGLLVGLTANDSRLSVPSSVVIAGGVTQVDVRIAAPVVMSNTSIAVTADFYGTTGGAAVMVVPTTLSALVPEFNDLAARATTPVVVRLTGPAGPGGIDVHFSETSGALSFPTVVHIVEGQSSGVVLVSAANVSVRTSVLLRASDGFSELTVPITVSPVDVTLLSLGVTTLTGGKSATGMITLGAPAPGTGVDIQLSSNQSILNVPTVVHIAKGATSATFTIGSRPVRDRVIVSITATGGTLAKSKSLTVNPAALLSVKVQQTSMTGGATQQGTVFLTGAAPAGGLLVPLSSTNPALQVPSAVEIPEGATSAVFSIRSVPVVIRSAGLVVAQVGVVKKSTSVSVNPPVISGITVSRATVVGGDVVGVTVTITGAAPAGGTTVLLTSGNVALKVPASVTVPAGQTSVVFNASSLGVSKSVSVKVSGKVASTSKSTYVRVTP